MYFIEEMQMPPEEASPHLYQSIESVERQWKEGRMTQDTYHSQLSLLYSIIKDVDECRRHAALVSDKANKCDRSNVLMSLARMYVHENKMDDAIVEYKKLIELSDDHEKALEELGWCYYHCKQFEEAEASFKKAIEVEPTFSCALEGLGLAASQQKRYEEAIVFFTRALEAQNLPEYAYYYEYLIGLCYANLDDFYRALAHYTKSLDSNPSYAPSLTNIATLYYNHEADIKTAISYLKKAETIAEEDEDTGLLQTIYINLIRLYSQIAEYDLKEYYNAKLLEVLGFGGMFSYDEDEEDED